MSAMRTALIAARTSALLIPRVGLDAFTALADEPASALADLWACVCCSLVLGDETLRRFRVFSDPDCFGVRTYSTHDPSGLGVSQIEGITSSGPDSHEAVSESAGLAVFAPLLILGLGSLGTSFFSGGVVGVITHDSPRAGAVGVVCSADMATCHGCGGRSMKVS